MASRNGPDVYLKAMEKLELYAFTKYKLGTKDVWKYLQHPVYPTRTGPAPKQVS